MGNLKYEVMLYWSKEDKAYIAEVPELPGCAADGKNYQEALDNDCQELALPLKHLAVTAEKR
jgi:predicted RNase H-like HicB family nuclease